MARGFVCVTCGLNETIHSHFVSKKDMDSEIIERLEKCTTGFILSKKDQEEFDKMEEEEKNKNKDYGPSF